MPYVRLSQVTKFFGAVNVIPPLDLDIGKGEFLVLVGPSGCGKTTTLRMIAGLENVSDGTISINGKDVTRVRPGLRNCAMVFQNYALYPHMTVADNIAYGMRVRGEDKNKIKERVLEASRLLGLDPYLDRKPRFLSGGQRQRVAIGRAIVRHPDVFLFDEPLSNLDAKLRVEMRTEIKQLQRRLGTTAVYVTHDQVEAMTMADTVVVMNEGRIEQAAPPITLYEEPANRFVAGFIGAPSMNFFDGVLQVHDGAVAVDLGGQYILPLGPRDARRLADGVGRAVVLGIRPEHMTGGADGPARINLKPISIEPLGPHTIVIGRSADAPVTAQVDAHFPVDLDDDVPIQVDMDKAHFFDAETLIRL